MGTAPVYIPRRRLAELAPQNWILIGNTFSSAAGYGDGGGGVRGVSIGVGVGGYLKYHVHRV